MGSVGTGPGRAGLSRGNRAGLNQGNRAGLNRSPERSGERGAGGGGPGGRAGNGRYRLQSSVLPGLPAERGIEAGVHSPRQGIQTGVHSPGRAAPPEPRAARQAGDGPVLAGAQGVNRAGPGRALCGAVTGSG